MISNAIWVAKSLFDRGKTSGSSANLSFIKDNQVYITGTNTCFGSLTPQDFAVLDLDGTYIKGSKPSKEAPMHLALYKKRPDVQAIIHTHSFYSTLWSCIQHKNEADIIPNYTPYLRMKIGPVPLIGYAPPGSLELAQLVIDCPYSSKGYLLANHGPLVGDQDILSAFYNLEELEESARIAWEITKHDKIENTVYRTI